MRLLRMLSLLLLSVVIFGFFYFLLFVFSWRTAVRKIRPCPRAAPLLAPPLPSSSVSWDVCLFPTSSSVPNSSKKMRRECGSLAIEKVRSLLVCFPIFLNQRSMENAPRGLGPRRWRCPRARCRVCPHVYPVCLRRIKEDGEHRARRC